MDALWPELDPPAAAANLRKALHSARRSLDADGGAELILSAGDLLCLPSDGLSVDVDEYWSLVSAARRTGEISIYRRAVEAYKDGLLPEDRYEDWAVAAREELHAEWLVLVEELAGLLEARCDLNGAARAVQRLIAADPLREENHTWLMRLYTLGGRRDEARRQYARLRNVLAEELGVEPRPETQRQFEEINSDQTSEPDLSSDLWERVGDLRVQSGDPAGAVKVFGQALSTPAGTEATGRIHRKCAGAWLTLHMTDQAEPHLQIAESLEPSPAERGRLACLRANLAWERGDLLSARHLAEQAFEIARADGDADDVAVALEALAFIAHVQGTWRPGLQAQIEEFDRRGVKIMALSVDPVDKHAAWAADIEETQGTAPNYPMIGDADFTISKAYGMLGADVSGDPADRTAADNQTVRSVFVIGPDKKIKLIMLYPMTTGRNFDEILRVIDSLQLTAKHKVATPANWKQGEDVVIAGSVSNEQAKEIFGDWTEPKPYIRIVPQPA